MAKSKTSKTAKRKRARRNDFYEALPMSSVAPPLAPEISDQLTAGKTELIRYGRAITDDLAAALGVLRRTVWGRRARLLYVALASAGIVTAVAVGTSMSVATMRQYGSMLASANILLNNKKTGVTILDRNGKVLYQGYGADDSKPVTLDAMPKSLKDATLAAEDPGFYNHSGFSVRGTARAAWVDITHQGTVEGGSTLTQQLVKRTILNSNKTFARKYQELVLSIELEKHYSKDQILEMYLNDVYYGEGANGIQSASQTYFHKDAKDLDLSQSALLAGLPQSPSYLDPNISLSEATARRNYVLERMAGLGDITTAQAKAAEAEPIAASARVSSPIQAPWFVFYVLDQLKATYGEDAVENDGMTVRTTLDLNKQTAAETIIQAQIANLSGHNVTNGALVSMDPTSGEIFAMVGSANYDAPGWGAFNVVTQGARQPGSSFKPFAYVTAFEKGWTGATTVDDAPLSLPIGNGQYYTPENYDLKFHGVMTLRHALDNSLNIPAIKVVQYAGVDNTIATADSLGATVDANAASCGVALVLGCGDVTPLDMATGYGTFANGGVKVMPKAILDITDRYGKDVTKDSNTKPAQMLDPKYAAMITNILSDNSSRVPEFQINSPLLLSRPSAAKTGTTNDFRDNWTVGYTPGVVTAVWVGNSDNSPMENVDGVTGAAPIWHNYMELALAGTPVQNFTLPASVTTAKVCTLDGGLANPWDTVGVYTEVFPIDALPTKHCGTSQPIVTPPTAPVTPLIPTGVTTDITIPEDITTPERSVNPGHIIRPITPIR